MSNIRRMDFLKSVIHINDRSYAVTENIEYLKTQVTWLEYFWWGKMFIMNEKAQYEMYIKYVAN